MIVPRLRLLFWFSAVVLPGAVLGAVVPAMLPLSVAAIAGLLVLVCLDATLSLGRLEGLSVTLPEVVRMSQDRAGAIAMDIRNPSQRGRSLRLGLPLPAVLSSPHEDLEVRLPDGSELSRLSWPCRPARRGHERLDRVCLEAGSRLGFWAVRGVVPVRCEVRVYPNLLTERRHLAALFLNRGMFGVHARRQVGQGREFEKLREYVSGDGYDEIHWKATAKRGHPITKVFQIERTQEVYVMVDASRLSARLTVPSFEFRVPSRSGVAARRELRTRNPEAGTSVLDRCITAALVLGLAAERQGDLFGLLTFADRVEGFLRARTGRSHYNACRDALYTLEARTVTPNFDEVAAFIRLRLRRRALLVFLTALDDPVLAESFVRNMELLHRQHLVLVNMLRPPGVEPLFSRPDVTTPDDLYERLGGHLQWHNLRELEKRLQRRGVQFSLLDHEKLSVELVSQYLGVKRRQAL